MIINDELNIEREIASSKNRLLDLTLRNNLLNFKPRRDSINCCDEDIIRLYDLLVLNEKTMKFLPKNSHNESSLNFTEPNINLDKYIQTNHDETSLKRILSSLYRKNKSLIEEEGYNSFYLALGFLEWKESNHQDASHKAPLILVPLKISRESISSPFSVNWYGEDILCNLSLISKLKEQEIIFPCFEEFKSKEELKDYLNEVKEAIRSTQWKIHHEIYFSNFSFKKFIMFKDLDSIGSNIKEIFSQEHESVQDSGNALTDFKSSKFFNVLDADSSQLAVLNEVKKGKNLVVEGPPGTGKSQTIVNIIAELLAQNKKVLFVSEKKAALDVVKDRLDSVGLGESCLELHSRKSNKKHFLEELQKTLELDSVCLSDKSKNEFQDLDKLKKELNEYVNIIHTPYKNTELTPYYLMGVLEETTQFLENHNQEKYNLNVKCVNINTEKRGEYYTKLKKIKTYYDLVKPISGLVWRNTHPLLSSPEIRDIKEELNELIHYIEKYIELDNNISNLIGTERLNNFKLDSLVNNAKILKPHLKLLNDSDNLDELILNISTFQDKSKNIDLNVLDLNLEDLKNEINNLMKNINSLNLNLEITEKEDFKTINSRFKLNKQYIEESNLEKALYDPDLIPKFIEFKTKKNSLIKRTFSRNFRTIKKEFKSYYDTEVSDNQIVDDFEKLIKIDTELSEIRDKILAYTNQTTSDEKILIESEKLLSWADDLNKIKSKLNTFKITTNNTILKDSINNLIELKKLLTKIENDDKKGQYYFNETWKSYKSNVSELNHQLEDIKKFKRLYNSQFFSDNTLKFINNARFNELNVIYELTNTKSKIIQLYDFLNNKLNFKNELLLEGIESVSPEKLKELMSILFNDIDNLDDYRLFVQHCDKYNDNNISEIIELIKEDRIKSECIVNLFRYTFVNNVLKDVFKRCPILDEFNYKLHENNLEQFKKLDLKTMKSNQVRIKEILANQRPNIAKPSKSSSLGILKHEMSKKRRIKPIRKLLSQTYDVISSIKPCFLMSPLSIATHLDPQIFKQYFDYVIFDEASQVKIEDAWGAIARGKHYVIMGDTKQLPPTNFFDIESTVDEDEFIYSNDLESILHFCKNIFDSKMLKWHYRSRHDSLISFSNSEFYNNKLHVFPSPIKNAEDLGLKIEYKPNTTYLRGEGSCNPLEAEAVVDYVFDCVKRYGHSKSIGVGTFSAKQSRIIEDVLETKLKDNSELKEFFNESTEGFFIKNLENIQGDERDIIIISVGYGKDQNSKFNLNFGPLNHEGGERRLNVLITRAKEQCIVFSNFKSSEMHTNDKTPRSIECLKNFLHYAETGEFAPIYHTGEDFDSPFEESVYNFLTDEGYEVEKQVGCAGYKIDLAIVDKDNANRYILAIECDGATYHSSKLSRDRDRLRQEILENLGWKFHRIWSTDWYHNRSSAKKRLVKTIEETIENKDNIKIAKKIESDSEPEIIVKPRGESMQEELDNYFTNYIYFTPYGDNYLDKSMLKSFINCESPVHIDDMYDCLKVFFNHKATKKFKRDINKVLSDLTLEKSIVKKGNFYYSPNFDEKSFRVRKRKSPKIDRIPNEEIQKAIIATLNLQFSLKRDDLIKEASKYLGFNILRDKNRKSFNDMIDQMIYKGKLKENNNKITTY